MVTHSSTLQDFLKGPEEGQVCKSPSTPISSTTCWIGAKVVESEGG